MIFWLTALICPFVTGTSGFANAGVACMVVAKTVVATIYFMNFFIIISSPLGNYHLLKTS
jgi:hypothetical protein